MPGKENRHDSSWPRLFALSEPDCTAIDHARLVEKYHLRVVSHPVWTLVRKGSTLMAMLNKNCQLDGQLISKNVNVCVLEHGLICRGRPKTAAENSRGAVAPELHFL